MAKQEYVMAITTCRDENEAKRIINVVLNQRRAACVNIIRHVQSHYWWRDKINMENEIILQFKTKKSAIEELKKAVLVAHTYENPEFIVLPIIAGSDHYLNWIEREVK